MSSENLHIAGRYCKYMRNLSQSPWIDKDDVRVKDSVQELLEDGLKKYLNYFKSTFASSGREDVDVRMLGRGRPFVFKIQNPELADLNDETLREITDYINTKHAGKVSIRDLQIVTKADVSKYMTESLESKRKEYRALCCCSRKLTQEDINKINTTTELVIDQMTPIRVLHRRTLATRKRTIHQMRVEPVKIGDFDSVKEEHLERVFSLILTTEAGTYIKEFVHGDFGRTQPNLASLLGDDIETDLMELDVLEVFSDWPPYIEEFEGAAQEKTSTMSHHGTFEKLDDSPERLTDLYSKGLKSMQEAESMQRGDKRQDLYLTARQLFANSAKIVERLSLFSDNESVDDIATSDLKYLLIPAYLAKIMTSYECSSNRLATLNSAHQYAISFLKSISNHEFGFVSIDAALRNCSEIPEDQTKLIPLSGSTSLENAALMRNQKIERYKKAKELEDQLNELERRFKESGQEYADDEVARSYYLKLIEKKVSEVIEDLEREILPAICFEKARSTGFIHSNLEAPSSSDGPKSRSGKPITIVRDQFQKQIYGVGYPSRPTVTVDEFITKKIDDGSLAFDKHKDIYANSLQRYAEQPNLRREQEEQSDEEREQKEDRHDEEELQRKRKWDEFKDDNPRGSGNRHNMG